MSNVLVYIRSVSYGLYDAGILRGFPGFLISRIFPYCPDLRVIHTARQQDVPDFRISLVDMGITPHIPTQNLSRNTNYPEILIKAALL